MLANPPDWLRVSAMLANPPDWLRVTLQPMIARAALKAIARAWRLCAGVRSWKREGLEVRRGVLARQYLRLLLIT